jgi:hypothetical protein
MLASPSGGSQANVSRNQMSTPKDKPASLPKTAALTKAQAGHKAMAKGARDQGDEEHTSHLTPD